MRKGHMDGALIQTLAKRRYRLKIESVASCCIIVWVKA